MPEGSSGGEGKLQIASLIEALTYRELKDIRATIDRAMVERRSEALAAFERERAALVTEYDLDAAPAGVVDERAAIPTPGLVRIKYRDAETGAHWSGRGKQPGWLKDKVAAGHDLAEFEVS